MKNENENYRVIVTAKDIVISFKVETEKELEDRLHFLFMSLKTPEKFIYDENKMIISVEFNTTVIVALVNNILDTVIFPLSEYKKYI